MDKVLFNTILTLTYCGDKDNKSNNNQCSFVDERSPHHLAPTVKVSLFNTINP